MNTRMARAAAGVGGLAIAAAFAVSCSAAKEATKDTVSGASSAASAAGSAVSSGASAAGSAVSSGASVAGSAASSGASAAGSAVSSGASAASSVVSSGASAAGSAVSSGASAASSVVSSGASAVADAFNAPATTITAPGVGDVAINTTGAAAYTRLGGAAALGAPTAAPQQVKDADSGGQGWVYTFEKGSIYDSPDRGAYLVQGEILKAYEKEGGPAGKLGWPTSDEATTGGGYKTANGGWVSEFENGSITWLNDGKGTFSATVTNK